MDNFTRSSRSLIAVSGTDRIHFLQGLLTQDMNKLTADKIQFAALLSPQGKILHDMFVLDGSAIEAAMPETILLDIPALAKETLLKRLTLYKLRAAVTLASLNGAWDVTLSSAAGLADPRHPALPRRLYCLSSPLSEITPERYRTLCLSLGIPDSAYDFAADEIVALDAGYDLLHAISFTKGCYVGQEITARMHYKNIARRGFYILEREGAPVQLALLKFEEVEKSGGIVTRDNVLYQARLPSWMLPKLDQFRANQNGD